MIGSGLYGLLFADVISKYKKVLIIEAGDIYYMSHINKVNSKFTLHLPVNRIRYGNLDII